MKTLRQSRYPPKSLRIRSLWLAFVVCFIVFISIILNMAHHSLSREYTTMRCKDTNFLSYKYQNARKFIHIYDSLTLKQAFFRIFGCYGKRPIHPPSWRIDPCYSREVRVNKYVYAILIRLDSLLQVSLLFRQLLTYSATVQALFHKPPLPA